MGPTGLFRPGSSGLRARGAGCSPFAYFPPLPELRPHGECRTGFASVLRGRVSFPIPLPGSSGFTPDSLAASPPGLATSSELDNAVRPLPSSDSPFGTPSAAPDPKAPPAMDRGVTPLSRCINFRDFGGLEAREGVVRKGQLYRTAHLSQADEEAARHISSLGVVSYFDFRIDSEIERDGAPEALTRAGIRWERRPFDLNDEVFSALEMPAPNDWSELYQRGFARLRPAFTRVIVGLAAERAPVVIGCWAGKDRTGIVAALVLALLGVADETVAVEYGRTTDGLRAHEERFQFLWEATPERREEIFSAYCGAPPSVMASFLRAIRLRHGPLPEALDLPLGTVDALKQRLLE